jgi:hypothetical protein
VITLGYAVWLHMSRNDKPGCGYGTSTGPDAGRQTLGDIMAEAFRMATFYLSDRGDGAYTRVDVRVEEHCAACSGSGTTGRTRTLKPIKCKACKGGGARREVFHATWKPYDHGGRDFVTCVMNERPQSIRYTLHQNLRNGSVWRSPDVFEAASIHHVKQAVVAGFITGEPRWAEDGNGKRLFGLDANGNPS